MIEDFSRALRPMSLLDVVDKEILQALMQGFVHRQKAGMTLLYSVLNDAGTTQSRLERLDPEGQNSEIRDQFNPFCAKFREDPACNSKCQACDENRARSVLANPDQEHRYQCHMGLIDLTIPIRINGEVRAVLYGGQRIESSDESLRRIEQQVRRQAPQRSDVLLEMLHANKESTAQIDEFQKSLETFAHTLQLTVDALQESKQQCAQNAALAGVIEILKPFITTDATEAKWDHLSGFLDRLSELADGTPMWLLCRRGSRYDAVARSPNASPLIRTLRASLLLGFDVSAPYFVDSTTSPELARALKDLTGSDSVTLIRSDCPIGASNVASTLLIAAGRIPQIVAGMCHNSVGIMTYPVAIDTLLERLQSQQTENLNNAAFTGHHLKTPLTLAQWELDDAIEFMETMDRAVHPALQHLEKAVTQINRGIADAHLLMQYKKWYTAENFDIKSLIDELTSDFQPAVRRRNIQIRVLPTTKSAFAHASRHRIKVALSNLIDNAIKYSFEDKTIDIRISLIDDIKPKANRPRKLAQIHIQNYGVGFSEESKQALFEYGARIRSEVPGREREGMGIGLWQALRHIEQAGGMLDIESTVVVPQRDSGGSMHRTVVIVRLPTNEEIATK